MKCATIQPGPPGEAGVLVHARTIEYPARRVEQRELANCSAATVPARHTIEYPGLPGQAGGPREPARGGQEIRIETTGPPGHKREFAILKRGIKQLDPPS